MTDEQRVSLYRKLIVLFLILAVGTGAWIYPRSDEGWFGKFKLMLKFNPESGASDPAKAAPRPENFLTIIHFHLPGEPASEQVAGVLHQVGKKYGDYLEVNRAAFEVQPEDWMKRAKIKLPYVLMIHDKKIACQHQGVWSLANVEKKVNEILFSIKTMDKDWWPEVPGMISKGS